MLFGECFLVRANFVPASPHRSVLAQEANGHMQTQFEIQFDLKILRALNHKQQNKFR
jgi:hypothetical protein